MNLGAVQPSSCPGSQDVTGIIGNKVQGNAGFHMQKKFSENYPQLGHVPLERSVSPVLGRKILKNIDLKWHQIVPARGAHLSRAGPKQSDGQKKNPSTY